MLLCICFALIALDRVQHTKNLTKLENVDNENIGKHIHRDTCVYYELFAANYQYLITFTDYIEYLYTSAVTQQPISFIFKMYLHVYFLFELRLSHNGGIAAELQVSKWTNGVSLLRSIDIVFSILNEGED